MKRRARVLVAVAALILLATAAFHGSGHGDVSAAIAASSASAFLQGVVPGLWLFFSWHLVAIGLGALAVAMRGGRSMKPLLWFVTVVTLVDTLWLLKVAGVFAGTGLLALSALCLAAGAAQWDG